MSSVANGLSCFGNALSDAGFCFCPPKLDGGEVKVAVADVDRLQLLDTALPFNLGEMSFGEEFMVCIHQITK